MQARVEQPLATQAGSSPCKQECAEDHVEPEETPLKAEETPTEAEEIASEAEETASEAAPENRVPFTWEQMRAQQEERAVCPADGTTAEGSNEDEMAVEDQQGQSDPEEGEILEYIPRKKAEPLHRRSGLGASGSSFHFRRSLQGACLGSRDYFEIKKTSGKVAEAKAEMTAETVVEKTQDAACLDQQLISQDFQELGDLMQQGKKGEDASQDLSREAREEAVPSASQTDQKLQNSAVSMLQMWPPLGKAAAPAPLLLQKTVQKTVQKIEDVPRASEYDFRNGFSDGRTVSYSVASPAKECSMHASLFTPWLRQARAVSKTSEPFYAGLSSWGFPNNISSFEFSSHGYSAISNRSKPELTEVLSLIPHLYLRFPRRSHALFSIQGEPWWCQVEGELCETVGLPRLQATFPVNAAGPYWAIVKLIRRPIPSYLPDNVADDTMLSRDPGPVAVVTQIRAAGH